ncbi:MAG TPA: hypothetical protein DCP28_24960, partial [Cytophagales bacterium]|nr:hypothetical protein [Cytophagales bacterium]
ELMLVYQVPWVGAPQIWNGDELGMWGGDDPDCRKPLWWPDMEFEAEVANPFFERPVPADEVGADLELWKLYQRVIALRNEHPVLVSGTLEFLTDEHHPDILAYTRTSGTESILVVLNASGNATDLAVPSGDWQPLWETDAELAEGRVNLGAWSVGVWQQ